MANEESIENPCGEYHPLPCGLDKDCPVPVDYFNPEQSNTEVWKTYQENKNKDNF